MKTIKCIKTYEYIINKSRFISISYKVENIDEIKQILKEIRSLYPLAKHYTYAYRLINTAKKYDDGEPSGTASNPIFEQIILNDLYNTLIVVIRYFGGILLGASGLSRAYRSSASNCLKDNMIEIIYGFKIVFYSSYSKQSYYDKLLHNYKYNKEYLDNIKYTAYILKKDIDKFPIITKEEELIEI